MNSSITKYLNTYSSAATLAFFRLAFGIMMFFSLIRFALNGWIEKFYITPQFHFTYYGFGWVKPIGNYTYLLFIICALAAIFVAIGYKYKLAILTFFLSFTYIELIEKTTYLNHYYFITLVSFVLLFLPANCYFSVDAHQKHSLTFEKIPRWNIDILKVLLAIVYIYAGLAKINSDWLFEAMPLKIWLPANSNLPIVGSFFNQNWLQYAFSWIGMIYDLTIVFLLINKRTRYFAFALVVIFHVLTRILFPIGVFPFVMIISTLVFFESNFHSTVLKWISNKLNFTAVYFENNKEKTPEYSFLYKSKILFLSCFLAFQIVFPFRYLLYPKELFWTEEGFRFSWRVMLMEKAGYAEFTVTDALTKKEIKINNSLFLTSFQEKQMSFQPDFILEYAHYLHDYYQQQGINNPEVRVESYVALNGRLSQKFIDPEINLANIHDSFQHKTWILPFNDTIDGL
ncbi:HTTM domain-containing protein [Flavobacterium cellulosilyticum]|uniref:HTTM domain-containing protein n=1 Tax=Flavobacterium cellulosilyticum TaxID=2541731 RepID=A0A4V2YZ90_9FLAO|nr:HTTM domain-containing protein [Flavobacterium cellulosilyticum]TDD96167.1 HTTM domain-containing protein [Flavobacterium cellulosilyticum]